MGAKEPLSPALHALRDRKKSQWEEGTRPPSSEGRFWRETLRGEARRFSGSPLRTPAGIEPAKR